MESIYNQVLQQAPLKVQKSFESCFIYMKKEKCQDLEYFLMDLNKSMWENLTDKCIIEYPILLVYDVPQLNFKLSNENIKNA